MAGKQVALSGVPFRYRRVSLEEGVERRREIFSEFDDRWILYSAGSSSVLNQARVRIDSDYDEGFYAQFPKAAPEVGFSEERIAYSDIAELLVGEGERAIPSELVDKNL